MKFDNIEIKEDEKISENDTIHEASLYKESVSSLEETESKTDENKESLQNHDETSPKDNTTNNQNITNFAGPTVAIVGVLIVAATNLVNFNLQAEFQSFAYEDGQIKYELNYSSLEEDNNLMIAIYEDEIIQDTHEIASSFEYMQENYTLSDYEVYNNSLLIDTFDTCDLANYITKMNSKYTLRFKVYEESSYNREFNVSSNGSSVNVKGVVKVNTDTVNQKLENEENLAVRFKATLKGNVGLLERTFDNYAIKITKQTSSFNHVNYYCDCKTDGYFKFTMDYNDMYGLFDNFEAYLEDIYGNKKTCQFSENMHDEQRIYVLDDVLKGEAMTFTIKFTNNGVNEVYSYQTII